MEKLNQYRNNVRMTDLEFSVAKIEKINEIVDWINLYERVFGRPTVSKFTKTNPNPWKRTAYIHPSDRKK
jgi:hypothetical protein